MSNDAAPVRKQRLRSIRNPLLEGREKGIWHADLAAKIKQYPKSAEAFAARQALGRAQALRINSTPGWGKTRKGIPDGWAGRRTEVEEHARQADADAPAIIAAMVRHGALEVAVTTDDRLAEGALTGLVAMVINPTIPTAFKRSVARSILAFSSPLPNLAGIAPSDPIHRLRDLNITASREAA